MIYTFAHFEVDLAAVELRSGGKAVSLEPQVFALLALLVENRERLVSKDELIEKVWDGRAVSDAAVASRVKSARQALGDDGKSQQFIRTIHGQGYRFVAPARISRSTAAEPTAEREAQHGLADLVERLDRFSRPSLAVLPFSLHRQRCTIRGPRQRAAGRADHRSGATALAVRYRSRIVLPPAPA